MVDDRMFNGKFCKGITSIGRNDMRTKTAWRNLVLSIYKQAVVDRNYLSENYSKSSRTYKEQSKVLDDFLHFKTPISEFYLNVIDAYNDMFETVTDVNI